VVLILSSKHLTSAKKLAESGGLHIQCATRCEHALCEITDPVAHVTYGRSRQLVVVLVLALKHSVCVDFVKLNIADKGNFLTSFYPSIN